MTAPLAPATVVSRIDLGPDLAIFRVCPERGPLPDFLPGQFVELGLAGGEGATVERRAYSLASTPADKAAFELLISRLPEGRLTPRLWSLRAGDRCWLGLRPLGAFTLEDVPAGKDLVLVATGTGIAPYVSMLRTYSKGGSSPDPARWRRCALVHGVRRAQDLAYADEIARLCSLDPTLSYFPTVSREPESSPWQGLRGRVQAVLQGDLCRSWSCPTIDPATSHVFLCGNPEMIAEVRADLVARGFRYGSAKRGGNVHAERYW